MVKVHQISQTPFFTLLLEKESDVLVAVIIFDPLFLFSCFGLLLFFKFNERDRKTVNMQGVGSRL